MNRVLVLSLLVCGLFSNSGCFLAQSYSKITAENSNAKLNSEKRQEHPLPTTASKQSEVDTELFRAILENEAKGDLIAVKNALEKGASPNAFTDLNEIGKNLTPLVLAVGNHDIVRLLLEKGAKPNILSKLQIGGRGELRSSSPLIEAASRSAVETVSLLLNHEADVNMKTDDGFPTLFSGIGNVEILHLMLERGANPNVQDIDGATPLIAIVSGATYDKTKVKRLKTLIEKGADPNTKNKDGLSALDIARSYKDQAVVEFLQNSGTQRNQSAIIGLIKNKPERSYGCYLTSSSEYDRKASERRYYFLDDELGGTMNIEGKDIFLEQTGDWEVKNSNGKKFVWTFQSQQILAKFDLSIKKTANEGSAVSYDAVITVTKGNKKETVKAKGFCGG